MIELAMWMALTCPELDAASQLRAERQVELVDRLRAKADPTWVLDALEQELLVNVSELDDIDTAADAKRCTYTRPTNKPHRP